MDFSLDNLCITTRAWAVHVVYRRQNESELGAMLSELAPNFAATVSVGITGALVKCMTPKCVIGLNDTAHILHKLLQEHLDYVRTNPEPRSKRLLLFVDAAAIRVLSKTDEFHAMVRGRSELQVCVVLCTQSIKELPSVLRRSVDYTLSKATMDKQTQKSLAKRCGNQFATFQEFLDALQIFTRGEAWAVCTKQHMRRLIVQPNVTAPTLLGGFAWQQYKTLTERFPTWEELLVAYSPAAANQPADE